MAVECWWCGDPSLPGDHLRTAVHRDVEERLLGLRQEWKVRWLDIPRCRRCRHGHALDRAVRYVLVGSFAVTGLMLLAWGASRAAGEVWADEWQLVVPVAWTLTWWILWWWIRLGRWRWTAPKPENHADDHPVVLSLFAEGWLPGAGPRSGERPTDRE
ncbi:hypothetical protein LX16_2587 [Stackebrandtia albiflava]|uniref:Uncharacterized protein n=1 Tax=Stackebrandtia albiflava TaxID=406432 RepID=A0A562V1Q1_9ACTN|nr:hypothetical protein [Stackebrandtia albiflava]TWJ11850.1 hypothetical protein LX16_2587 [Stackebrandtia albiflava]